MEGKLFGFAEQDVLAGDRAETLDLQLFGHVHFVTLGPETERTLFRSHPYPVAVAFFGHRGKLV